MSGPEVRSGAAGGCRSEVVGQHTAPARDEQVTESARHFQHTWMEETCLNRTAAAGTGIVFTLVLASVGNYDLLPSG